MATVTITIADGGTPVGGASIYAGEVAGKVLTTNVNGVVTKEVTEDFAVAVSIIIKMGETRRGTFGPILLEAGGSYTLDIGSTV